MQNFPNVFIFDHPLIKHKVSILRDKNTSMKEFRELVEEITTIMTYESMKDVELVPVEVETPLEKTTQYRIADDSVAIVPILRAGLGMVNGVHRVFPTAKVGHIGMYRDEETLQPQEYYCKLPDGIAEKTVFLVDPMLATGGSACDAVSALRRAAAGRSNSWPSSRRPRASKSSLRSTPTCPCTSRRSTDASTRTAISSPGSAMRATGSSAPSKFHIFL